MKGSSQQKHVDVALGQPLSWAGLGGRTQAAPRRAWSLPRRRHSQINTPESEEHKRPELKESVRWKGCAGGLSRFFPPHDASRGKRLGFQPGFHSPSPCYYKLGKEHSILFFFKCLFMWIYVHVWVCAQSCRSPQRTEEGLGSPRAGVRGGCPLPNVGAGNQASFLCKNNANSYWVSHLSSLTFFFRKETLLVGEDVP